MSRSRGSLKGVTKLGSAKTTYEMQYDASLLECFENNFPGRDYWVRFTCPEFASVNPETGAPYMATVLIQYIPDKFLVESKSLKLYMFSFRNSFAGGGLAEIVRDDLVKLLEPKYIEVEVRAVPREGIPGRSMANTSKRSAKYQRLAKNRQQDFKKALKESPVLEENRTEAGEEQEGEVLI